MQKNDAGFKMEFKKRNPDFKKPKKSSSKNIIPATGELGKHDRPKHSSAHNQRSDSDSSSEEDVLTKKRKEEQEHQKTEQAKLVEMALLEQVMNGQLDVLELLKSGEVNNSELRQKLQSKLLQKPATPPKREAPPVQIVPPRPPVPPQPKTPRPPVPPQPKNPVNPLLRTRGDSQSSEISTKSKPTPKSSKRKSTKTSTGVISSESSESSLDSSSSSDISISSESDSEEDSHKLTKKVKKLKSKNKKLVKKVKQLKKKLKTKQKKDKSDTSSKDSQSSKTAVKRNIHGQIMDKSAATDSPGPLTAQNRGANAPMTPQEYSAQQQLVRRVYDPQTGQYRMAIENPKPQQSVLPQQPMLPNFPLPSGPMPSMPPGLMPPSGMPPPLSSITNDTEIMEISCEDDLYLDVFKSDQHQDPPKRQLTQSNIRQDVFKSDQDQNPPKRHVTQSNLRQLTGEDPCQPSDGAKRRKDSESTRIKEEPSQIKEETSPKAAIVRSKVAADILKDFDADAEVLVDADDTVSMSQKQTTGKGNGNRRNKGKGGDNSRCEFCKKKHSSTNSCKKKVLFIEYYLKDSNTLNQLKVKLKEKQSELKQLTNKKDLMEKVKLDYQERKKRLEEIKIQLKEASKLSEERKAKEEIRKIEEMEARHRELQEHLYHQEQSLNRRSNTGSDRHSEYSPRTDRPSSANIDGMPFPDPQNNTPSRLPTSTLPRPKLFPGYSDFASKPRPRVFERHPPRGPPPNFSNLPPRPQSDSIYGPDSPLSPPRSRAHRGGILPDTTRYRDTEASDGYEPLSRPYHYGNRDQSPDETFHSNHQHPQHGWSGEQGR